MLSEQSATLRSLNDIASDQTQQGFPRAKRNNENPRIPSHFGKRFVIRKNLQNIASAQGSTSFVPSQQIQNPTLKAISQKVIKGTSPKLEKNTIRTARNSNIQSRQVVSLVRRERNRPVIRRRPVRNGKNTRGRIVDSKQRITAFADFRRPLELHPSEKENPLT